MRCLFFISFLDLLLLFFNFELNDLLEYLIDVLVVYELFVCLIGRGFCLFNGCNDLDLKGILVDIFLWIRRFEKLFIGK